MSQTRTQSAIETVVSTAIGFVVAYAANLIVLPAFGYPVTHGENFWIATIFTAISLVRGWLVRRMFNRLHRSTP
jgi:general stress protein CsbA